MEDVSFQSETKILFKKHKAKRKISQIDFKKVYLGKKIIDNELVATKAEKKNTPNPPSEPEAFILTNIKGPGTPKFITYGHTKPSRVLVTSLLGPNLEETFPKKQKQFSLQETCMTATQVPERIQSVHSHHFIHRNTKPDNFGQEKKTQTSFIRQILLHAKNTDPPKPKNT